MFAGFDAVKKVMMEGPDESGRAWSAGGWLGIITAGGLWTPLYDAGTFDENILNLIRQIKLAVSAQGGAGAEDEVAGFSVGDVREELERLRVEEAPAVAASSDADGLCSLPVQVRFDDLRVQLQCTWRHSIHLQL